jgi:hypothetical protein
MGVMPRKSGETFVITSDRVVGELSSKQAPKKRESDDYQVWTGNGWSATMADAATFLAIAGADEYIRANFARVMA